MRRSTDKSLANHMLRTILNRKLLIISVFLLVVISGMIATFLITPKYEANMSIIVSRDRIDPKISSSEKLPDIAQAAISDEEFNSELELIKSSEVIAGAVKELDLINNQSPRKTTWLDNLRESVKASLYNFPWRASAKTAEMKKQVSEKSSNDEFTIEKMVNRVAGNLDVTPIKKSRIIKVSYRDTDPMRAKKTLEAIYKKYVELHVQINENPEAAHVFNKQTETFNRKLDHTTKTLQRFDSQNGVSGAEIGVQRELLLKQLYEAKAAMNATRTEIDETEKRIASLQEKIDSQPEQIQTGSVSKYVSAIDRMKEELINLEQQRTQLLQKYLPNSRPVRENEERIQQLKKDLREETANPPQERSFALNDLRRRLVSDLYNAQTSLASLRERERNANNHAAKLQSEVALLNSKSFERADIERERSVNEEAYLLYQKKARENEISQILNKEQVMNFGIIDPPRTDGEQKNPKVLLNFLVLIFIGGAAGIFSAVILDKLATANNDSDLILSAQEIEQRLNIPLLAIIPVIEPSKIEKFTAQPRIFALLPPAAKTGKNSDE